jgi:hypothetical protein
MPAEYGRNLTDAAALMAEFTAGKFALGSLTFGATATTDALTHGLGAAPTFVLIHCSEAGNFSWAADGTTLTVTRETTVGAATWSYLIGILA